MNRIDRTIDNLLRIINELQQETAQYNQSIKGGIDLRSCDVIRSKSDLVDHVQEYDIDYIIFITPGQLVMQIDREEIDKLTESKELEDYIFGNWQEETIAIVVP